MMMLRLALNLSMVITTLFAQQSNASPAASSSNKSIRGLSYSVASAATLSVELVTTKSGQILSTQPSSRKTYFVSEEGQDTSDADGSDTSPWRTISKAMAANLQPGDEIVVRPGTYNEAINIDQGRLGGRLHHPALGSARRSADPAPSSAWNAISVNADYVVVDGFDIGGARGDGIEANNVHHIKILNNIVHGSGESGIQFNWSDFITIEGNETYNNASVGLVLRASRSTRTAISLATPRPPGFRTIVRDNISHDNVTKTGAAYRRQRHYH